MSLVLITGAASGLGWALTQAFFKRGDELILVDRDQSLLEQRVQFLEGGGRVHSEVLDLCDAGALHAFTEKMCRLRPHLDVLVNNAGITHRSPAINTRLDVLDRVVTVDYHAAVELTLGLYPALEAARGTVINIGSMAGWMPVPGRAAYCAAKSALHQFFEVFRAEVAHRGVRVLMVYPSFLDTPIEQNALGAEGGKAAHARSTVGKISSADLMAAIIVQGLDDGLERIFPDRFSAFAALLYRVFPRFFHRLIRRRFAGELPA